MTQRPIGEGFNPRPRDEFDGFLSGAIETELIRQQVELANEEIAARLTELLKSPDCAVACMSYPDGTLNPEGIALFEDGLVKDIPSGYDCERLIANEKWLYGYCLNLLRVLDFHR
jgi:hypothetical protein